MKPDHAHAYNALGYSFADRNTRLPEARKLIEKALELAPEDYFIIDSLGWVLYREGDLKGAARELRRAYGGRPDAEIGAHLGEVLWVLGERDEARRIWDESLKAGPENETLQKTIKRFEEVKRRRERVVCVLRGASRCAAPRRDQAPRRPARVLARRPHRGALRRRSPSPATSPGATRATATSC